jgi:GNAT superfamily N-acetyltransferase
VVRIRSYPEAAVPLDLRVQVAALQDQAWPGAEPSGPEPVHDPDLDPLEVLLVDGGRVIAALDILSKRLEHDGATFAASGLSTVVTDSARRGEGHGRRLVAAARTLMTERGADLGIFTCDTPLGPFYETAGWAILPGTVLIGGTPDDPFPSDRFDKVTLASFFTPHGRAHAAAFVGARVALYPGPVDRLW